MRKHKEPAITTQLAAWLATHRSGDPAPWFVARDAEEIVACGRALRRLYERRCSEPLTDAQESALEKRERPLRNLAAFRLDTALGQRPEPLRQFALVFNHDPRGPAISIFRAGDDPCGSNAVFVVTV